MSSHALEINSLFWLESFVEAAIEMEFTPSYGSLLFDGIFFKK